MSGWEVGDKALCVDASGAPELTQNKVYTVSGIEVGGELSWQNGLLNSWEGISLVLDGLPGTGLYEDGVWAGYLPDRFRKIRPDKHEACEVEFITLLKRSRVPA